MAPEPVRLGTSRVTAGNRVVLVKEVAQDLAVEVGDVVAFYKDEDGSIRLRKLQ